MKSLHCLQIHNYLTAFISQFSLDAGCISFSFFLHLLPRSGNKFGIKYSHLVPKIQTAAGFYHLSHVFPCVSLVLQHWYFKLFESRAWNQLHKSELLTWKSARAQLRTWWCSRWLWVTACFFFSNCWIFYWLSETKCSLNRLISCYYNAIKRCDMIWFLKLQVFRFLFSSVKATPTHAHARTPPAAIAYAEVSGNSVISSASVPFWNIISRQVWMRGGRPEESVDCN